MSNISVTTEPVRSRARASALPGAANPTMTPLSGGTTQTATRKLSLQNTLKGLPGGTALADGFNRLRGHSMFRHLKTSSLLAFGIDMVFSAGQAFKAAKTAYGQAANPVEGVGKGLLEAGKVFGKSMAAVTGGLAGMTLAGAATTALGVSGAFLPLLAGAAAFAGGHWLVDQFIDKKDKTPTEAVRETVTQAISNPFKSSPQA